jgi:DNA-binding transcriptional MerR regulator/DNA-directed RNA polymerase subunit RPC12/RpoP
MEPGKEVKSMSKYTTGELAKLCDVSLRTVQFYDTKGLLHPTELTEGGRRLYSDEDLKKLHLICMLKALGLSLVSIKGILDSQAPNKVLLLLLDEQSRLIEAEIKDRKGQKEAIKIIRENILNAETISASSINDIDQIMNRKRKPRKTYAFMLIFGIVMDIIEIGTLLLWIVKGVWLPFVICIPVVITIGYLITRMYYRNTAYICPECNAKFRPTFGNFVFSKHTPKTRKLKCTACGYAGYCVETFADEAVN